MQIAVLGYGLMGPAAAANALEQVLAADPSAGRRR